jgi:hypothetical protein
MSNTPNADQSVAGSLDVPSPEVVAEKRVWATPSFEEFDYTITQSGSPGGFPDGVATYS